MCWEKNFVKMLHRCYVPTLLDWDDNNTNEINIIEQKRVLPNGLRFTFLRRYDNAVEM